MKPVYSMQLASKHSDTKNEEKIVESYSYLFE